MEMKRAEEIFTSLDKIPVQYQGHSIWITSLNSVNQTARIKDDRFYPETKEVPVTELHEGIHH